MLRNVYLEGELGEKFVPHLQVECNTMQDVFRCLDANFPEFKPYFQQKHEEGAYIHIDAAGQELEDPEELLMEVGDKEGDIIISNVPAGAKGAVKMIVGAVLIVVGVLLKATPLAPISDYVIGLGIGMIVGGLMELMAPDPSVDKIENGDESYLFNGNVQSIVSGDPIPILYGRLRVPGQPAAAEVIGDSASYNGFAMGAGGSEGGGGVIGGAGLNSVFNVAAFNFQRQRQVEELIDG